MIWFFSMCSLNSSLGLYQSAFRLRSSIHITLLFKIYRYYYIKKNQTAVFLLFFTLFLFVGSLLVPLSCSLLIRVSSSAFLKFKQGQDYLSPGKVSEEPDKDQLNSGKSQRPGASARKSRTVIKAIRTEVVKKLEKGRIIVQILIVFILNNLRSIFLFFFFFKDPFFLKENLVMSQPPIKMKAESLVCLIKYASSILMLAFLNLILGLNALLMYSLVKFSN